MNTLPALQNLSDSLSGIMGTNRNKVQPNRIRANHDYEAIHCWADEYKHKKTTYRSYLKEAERLLLWCVIQQKKPLSSLDRVDFEQYSLFLSNPQPATLWCGPKGGRGNVRGAAHWRPFEKGLSNSAIGSSVAIINSLMNYLVDACYLDFNPLTLIRKKIDNSSALHSKTSARILEPDEWQAIITTVHQLPEDKPHLRDEKERLRFLLSILFLLGLRINELVSHTWGAFQYVRGQWWFIVRGKGDKLGTVPVNDSLLIAVKRYRTYLRLSELPAPSENTPLIASWRTGSALGARQINYLLKNIAFKAAHEFKGRPDKIEKLKHFSAHWIRHLSATHQDETGINFKYIKANHRHESDETTRRYVHSGEKARHDAMQKLVFEFN